MYFFSTDVGQYNNFGVLLCKLWPWKDNKELNLNGLFILTDKTLCSYTWDYYLKSPSRPMTCIYTQILSLNRNTMLFKKEIYLITGVYVVYKGHLSLV